jgi:pimeloyl-ACP methyl ester carboxylesterase
MCLTGAVDQTSGANREFGQGCTELQRRGFGVIEDCDTGPCFSTFNTFPNTSVEAVYLKLFSFMDSNDDGKVNEEDRDCQVTLLGFSWGGVNILRLAERYAADARVDTKRGIHRLIALDAYQPQERALTIPARVEAAYSFRHSKSPTNDCSRFSPLGPYRGRALECSASQRCSDYDFSLPPTRSYGSFSGGSHTTTSIDHCDVPEVAWPYVTALMEGRPMIDPPPRAGVNR